MSHVQLEEFKLKLLRKKQENLSFIESQRSDFDDW